VTLKEALIFERNAPGRCGWDVPEAACELDRLPADLEREDDLAGFPEVGELETLRHFVRLSQWNYSAATTMYPLRSCTMKYNPILNEQLAREPWIASMHPLVPDAAAQGVLRVIWELERALAAVSGLPAVSLQPAAGAQGELVGMMMVRAHHLEQGRPRKTVLIPASAHGTNPASSALCGYEVREVPVGERGILCAASIVERMDDDVAALMVTNPNTLGLFEEDIVRVAEAVHARGGLVYMDGANMNALLGVARPGDMGVDVMQFNLHKTFSTPHGGGGPGAGPVAVASHLERFLPSPRLVRDGEHLRWDEERPSSIGRIRAFHGNFGILVRALAYILRLGGPGLERVTRLAVLNANYLRSQLQRVLPLAYETPAMHEVVFSDRDLVPLGVTTLDVAKRLLDYGFYAPTIYFPLVVKGAMMMEPTESESRETLDEFVTAVRAIVEEARSTPDLVRGAPHETRLGRLDEVAAARRPKLRWTPQGASGSRREEN